MLNIPKQICKSCVARKQLRSPLPYSLEFTASKPLELLYVGIFGMKKNQHLKGERGYLFFYDFSILSLMLYSTNGNIEGGEDQTL